MSNRNYIGGSSNLQKHEMRARWLVEKDKNNTNGGSTGTIMYQRSITCTAAAVFCSNDKTYVCEDGDD